MTPRTQELLNFLVTSKIRVREAIDALPPHARDAPAAAGRWSVSQVVDHLATVGASIARLVKTKVAEGRAAGLGPETNQSSILWSLDVAHVLDRRQRLEAPSRIHPRPDVTLDDAWTRLEQVHEEAREAVAETDGLAIAGIVSPHRLLGPLNLYQWVIFMGAHELRHAQQIREAGTQKRVA
jgi:hypothetical protein